MAVDAGEAVVEVADEGVKLAAQGAKKLSKATETVTKTAREGASQLTIDGINQGENIARGLDDAGEELGKVYVDDLEGATKAVGKVGQTAKDVAQRTGIGLASSNSGCFVKKPTSVNKVLPNCIDGACQKQLLVF